MPPIPTQLFAPEIYPKARKEMRAYTIAAFRVAQSSEQLSLIPMSKTIISFLLKERATGYWKENEWLIEHENSFNLSASGLVICQNALAEQLTTHNTSTEHVEFWVDQFFNNTSLPRKFTTTPKQ